MVFVWIVLAVISGLLCSGAIGSVFGVAGAGVVAGQINISYPRVLLAPAALAALFFVAYRDGRTWMIVLSYVLVGLVVLFALFSRITNPSVERIQPNQLAARIDEYASGPGGRSMSLVVQGTLLSTITGGRFARHHLLDGSCPYCFVEQRLESLFATEGGGAAIAQGYRDRLRNGPTVEVHMRRSEPTEPWHLEFAAPRQQPKWDSEFGAGACANHRPAGTR